MGMWSTTAWSGVSCDCTGNRFSMPIRDRTNTPNYATAPAPLNYTWQEKDNLQQRSRDEKDAIAKASFDKEVERRVHKEKECHWLIDSEVQRRMTHMMPPLKRSAHVSVSSSDKYHSLSYVFFSTTPSITDILYHLPVFL